MIFTLFKDISKMLNHRAPAYHKAIPLINVSIYQLDSFFLTIFNNPFGCASLTH